MTRGAGERIVTAPNVLSALRLLGLPVFVWLMLGPQAYGWAFAILVFSGVSDWADGKIARLLDQYSRLGALLDPAADRIYSIVVPVTMAVDGMVPWWFVVSLLARDLALLASAPLLRSRGVTALPVLYVGKAATFALMAAFPFILAGRLGGPVGTAALPVGWGFAIWGLGLYLWSLVLYWAQTVLVLRRMPARAA